MLFFVLYVSSKTCWLSSRFLSIRNLELGTWSSKFLFWNRNEFLGTSSFFLPGTGTWNSFLLERNLPSPVIKCIIKQEKYSCRRIQNGVWGGRAPRLQILLTILFASDDIWTGHSPFKSTYQVQLLLRPLLVYATFIKILNVHTHQYLF